MANPTAMGVEIVFSGIDRLSGSIGKITDGILNLGRSAQKVGEHVGDLGERLRRLGELAVTAFAGSETANKLHEWSETISEPAEAMQQGMAGVAAMTNLAGDALDKIKHHAVEFSSLHPSVTAEQWIGNFSQMRDIFHDTTEAMQATDTAAMLQRLGVDSGASTRLMAIGWRNLGAHANQVGDQLTKTIQVFGLAPWQTAQFATAVGRLAGAAAAAHAPMSEVFALTGEAQQLFGGGRGGTIFASLIQQLEVANAKGKAHLDFSHGFIAALSQLKSQLVGTDTEKLAELSHMGIGSQAPELLKFLSNLDQISAKQQKIGGAGGDLMHTYAIATNDAADAHARLTQNVSNLFDALTTPALPTHVRVLNTISDSVGKLTTHLEQQPGIAGAAALTITGLGAAAFHGVQALSTLGTATIFAGEGIKAIKYGAKALDFEGLAIRGMYAMDKLGSVGSSISKMGEAISGFGTALLANPLTYYVAGALLLAAAGYEIYEHWGAVKATLERFWHWLRDSNWGTAIAALAGPIGIAALEIARHFEAIKKFASTAIADVEHVFDGAADWFKGAGINMMKALGEGILSGIDSPFKAAWGVAEKIGGLFHFHSPPDYGPLREALLNFRFSEELAKHIKPAPVIGPAHKLAGGIAAPISGVSRSGAGGGNVTINLHYAPVFNGTTPADFDPRKHADVITRLVEQKLARAARLSYE